jgi:hypothetical protein
MLAKLCPAGAEELFTRRKTRFPSIVDSAVNHWLESQALARQKHISLTGREEESVALMEGNYATSASKAF